MSSLIMTELLGVKVKSGREVGMQIQHATAVTGPVVLKKYDVFSSRIAYDRNSFREWWWEEFKPIGEVMAFNSVHAMKLAKEKYKLNRMAVIAAKHPLSPTSIAARAAKAVVQTAIAKSKSTYPNKGYYDFGDR